MEYTDFEKETLSLMKRTDFKNLSKSDVLSVVSKFAELRPDVQKDVIAQFPEFSRFLHSSIAEYKGILGDILSSDDESLKGFYSVSNKGMESAAESRRQFYALAEKVHADCSKCLENPNLSEEEKTAILDRELEVLKAASEKDTEVRSQEDSIIRTADRKDSEKRQFNWSTIKVASTVLVVGISIGASVLGGNVNLKLPKL